MSDKPQPSLSPNTASAASLNQTKSKDSYRSHPSAQDGLSLFSKTTTQPRRILNSERPSHTPNSSSAAPGVPRCFGTAADPASCGMLNPLESLVKLVPLFSARQNDMIRSRHGREEPPLGIVYGTHILPSCQASRHSFTGRLLICVGGMKPVDIRFELISFGMRSYPLDRSL